MPPVEVAQLGELEEQTPKIVRVGSQEVLLVRHGERVYALRNSCPHMSVSLAGGAIIPFVGGTPDAPRFDEGRLILTCPWHQYEFSLETGACLTSDHLAARTYDVMVDDGRVYVDIGAHAAEARRRRAR